MRILRHLGRHRLRAWILIYAGGLGLAVVAGVRSAEVNANSAAPLRFDPLLDEVPAYPGAPFYPLGDALESDGLTRAMAYAVTADRLEKVQDRYESQWRAAGHDVQRGGDNTQGWVMATSVRDPLVRSVLLTTTDDGRTGIAASSRHKLATAPASRVPRPDTCATLTSQGARDGALRTESVMLRCEARLAEVIAYYDRAWSGAERRVPLDSDDPHGILVSYLTAHSSAGLTVRQVHSEPPVSLVVLTWQEERP